MIFTFEREPLGWVHPFYRRPQHTHRHHHHHADEWNDFVRPALETVSTLNHMLELANRQPRLVQSLASQRAEEKKDRFEIKMDVQQFAPEELDVKMVENCLVVEGKHEEKQDEHGYISRHFVRRYKLPEDVKPETITCNLSSDGVLFMSAPRMIEQKLTERAVPINFTGKPAVTQQQEKEQQKEDGQNGRMEEASP
ncbi:Alpha-crystallin B chain [Orchesella cincta]|uniref:Alpha-crystallin B chain n=1 Tax=Orchesella cincta TaxID=48709 RepID=A0A1D2MGJ8_ORCCI|nr:Alpha-crystallin B chain [Orchesella cincta]